MRLPFAWRSFDGHVLPSAAAARGRRHRLFCSFAICSRREAEKRRRRRRSLRFAFKKVRVFVCVACTFQLLTFLPSNRVRLQCHRSPFHPSLIFAPPENTKKALIKMVSVEELRKVYEQFDDDKNGVLTFEEAEQAIKALGSLARDPNSFAADFARLAKDGVIGFDEFKQLAA